MRLKIVENTYDANENMKKLKRQGHTNTAAGQLLFETATKQRKCLRFNDRCRKFLLTPF